MAGGTFDTTAEERLRTLSRTVTDQTRHTLSGMVTDPVEIIGSRSADTAEVLAQLLDALSTAHIIVDSTTG